jgi:hypothetical protein
MLSDEGRYWVRVEMRLREDREAGRGSSTLLCPNYIVPLMLSLDSPRQPGLEQCMSSPLSYQIYFDNPALDHMSRDLHRGASVLAGAESATWWPSKHLEWTAHGGDD